MQKIATHVFTIACITFGILGISMALFMPGEDNEVLTRLLMATVFIVLSSFGVSVAGKYLKNKD